jgi:hypothetical protein
MELDPWEDIILGELARLINLKKKGEFVLDGRFTKASDTNGNPEWRVSTDYLLTEVLNLPKERQNNNHTKRLASTMHRLGWTRSPEPLRFGKEVKRGYTMPMEM